MGLAEHDPARALCPLPAWIRERSASRNLMIPVGPLGQYRQTTSRCSTPEWKRLSNFTSATGWSVLRRTPLFNSSVDQNQDNVTAFKTTTLNGQKVTYQRFLAPTTVISPRIFRNGGKFTF
jgi:hypothetical protein